jgi:hypothetical protein
LRVYFTITPGRYDEATKLMKQLMRLCVKYKQPKGRVLTGHFVSPGQPNWQWEAEFPSVAAAQKHLDMFDEMPEMAKLGPATYGVWNQQGVELYHVVELS